MKVSIFGGSGFVGEYIIEELLNSNYSPYILLRYGSELKIKRYSECKIITGNIDNDTAIEQTMMNTEAVIYNIGIIREFKSSPSHKYPDTPFCIASEAPPIVPPIEPVPYAAASINDIPKPSTDFL